MGDVSKSCDARILTIEYHGSGGRFGGFAQQFRGIVDFAETVELVAHHVEQQAVVGLYLFDEMHRVRFVEFQYGDVGVQFAAERNFRQQRRDHTTGEVRSGRIGEHL